jgi:tetratricopeptide (TPR) repeat protein
MKNILWIIPATLLLASCGTKEKEALQSRVDSLSIELENSQRMANTLVEVGALMDSIDVSRQLLRMNMVEGTTYEDYTSRMRDLNQYVKDTEKKITDLENALKKSEGNTASYARQIKKLKDDLQAKSNEVLALQEMVEKYRSENQNLVSLAEMQSAEISDKELQIQTKEQELALIEARIQELMIQSKVSEADAYFARGQAVEEAANRTKLAPRKKKETYQEAIELYRKALSLGNQEAQARITELEKKL